jgi:hypothetical protein
MTDVTRAGGIGPDSYDPSPEEAAIVAKYGHGFIERGARARHRTRRRLLPRLRCRLVGRRGMRVFVQVGRHQLRAVGVPIRRRRGDAPWLTKGGRDVTCE